ncbi:hypothetical protein [Sulfurospirillum arcachonense]|uniref:hypothetical protein n=1 Tax=Sulfurospirillum arcachonense TaxID=57666 RepID=UPI0004693C58|nr:hypothetical protein [Sulfurospirillum arcachonense]
MKFISILLMIMIFSGCTNSQQKIKELFQTDNATHLKKDYYEMVKLLISYKKKLDARNPKSFDKQYAPYIYQELNNNTNKLFLKYENKYISDYNQYLKIALDKEKPIKNRNDYLILGIYKYMYKAYQLNESHQVTTLSYDKKSLESLYYALKVLRWQIRTKKDINNKYLFLTWQNNWQIELQENIKNGEKPSWELIQKLQYIANEKESIYSSSNFNFEIILTQMIHHVKNSLIIMDNEPLDVSIEAMKSLIFFL